jgi:hypothetical protein
MQFAVVSGRRRITITKQDKGKNRFESCNKRKVEAGYGGVQADTHALVLSI